MKVIAINGSPRKNWNTYKMLKEALKGAKSKGAEVELINLYDYDFKGCTSCFTCKRVNKKERVCAMHDDLAPVLEKIRNADAVIFGSPIYFSGITAGLRGLLERLCFPWITYSRDVATFCPKVLPSAFIYTMNAPEQFATPMLDRLNPFEGVAERLFGSKPDVLCAFNTYQFKDYNKYEHSMMSVEDKKKSRDEQFPKDLEAARALGEHVAQRAVDVLESGK